jgi:hypothetical protein
MDLKAREDLERKQACIEVVRESDISERIYDMLFKSKQKKFIKNNKKEQVQWDVHEV